MTSCGSSLARDPMGAQSATASAGCRAGDAVSRAQIWWPRACSLAAVVALGLTAPAGAELHAAATSRGTFVFGTDSDPIVLDAALARGDDLNSPQVANQIVEGLVEL